MLFLKKALPVLFVLSFFGCKNPTDNIKIIVNTNIIKFSAMIQIVDGTTGLAPADIDFTVSGQNAAEIYEISGKKVFKVVDGIITIGTGPDATPLADSPIKFNINITAKGYNAVVKAIQINEGQLQQVLIVNLFKPGSNSEVIAPQPTLPVTTTPVTLNFSATCSNKANFVLKPSVYLFYRETGSNTAFRYLGFMDKGLITSTALTIGKTYDFRLTYGGQNYTVTQKTDITFYDLSIDMGTVCSTF